MFYTPKHCCECGEKIVRNKWKILTSRRFCETCESEFTIFAWLPRLFFALCVLIVVFGIGSALKKTDQPLNVSPAPLVSVESNKNQSAQNSLVGMNSSSQLSSARSQTDNDLSKKQAPILTLSQKQSQAPDNPQNSASETIYICGAQTKKGTPCSRRVKGGGRCWQHKGQPAMLPPEKLIVSR